MRRPNVLDKLTKLFQRRKVKEGYAYCDICGNLFPREELHEVVMFFNTRVTLLVCDSCTDIPPSLWRVKHGKRKRSLY